MSNWALNVVIECKDADREAANKTLESLGWGPCINVPVKGGTWTTSIPCRAEMLPDLQRLAEKHPKLTITVGERTQGNAKAKSMCKEKVSAIFDKAEFQSTAANRTKAKVDVTSLKAATVKQDAKAKVDPAS